jgi:GNAT superfamily N-acetyltransferase
MLQIRPATTQDVPALFTMIHEFAEYVHESELVTIRQEDLVRDGWGANPLFRVLIAEWDREVAGYAVFFGWYSTWAGRGLFLEDLFVKKSFRQHGIGKALLASVAQIAVQERCYGIHWEVLDWNQGAIDLYKALGAEFRDHHRAVLLHGAALRKLAEQAS